MTEDTLLLRQVHPSFVQGDSISSQVFSSQTFKPTPKDQGLLSVYNGEKFTPDDAFIHYTTNQNLESAGVVAVSSKECQEEELPVNEDNDPFDGHCSINYNGLSNSQISKKAQKLKAKAATRGWLYSKS